MTERATAKLRQELGPNILMLIDEPGIEDILVNPDGQVWTNQGMVPLVMSADHVRSIINTVAAMNDTVVTFDNPSVEAVLPFGDARFKGVVAPEVPRPIFAIRTRPKVVFSIWQLIEDGTLTQEQADRLCRALSGRKNILIGGATGSGKTTLLNACLDYIAKMHKDERIICIEDTPEIDCKSPNSLCLRTTENRTMGDCLRDAMRLVPKRIVVGEVRGAEALALLEAWNTGHDGGVATIHASSLAGSVLRLKSLVRKATEVAQDLLVHQAIHVIVFMEKDCSSASGRRVREIRNMEYV